MKKASGILAGGLRLVQETLTTTTGMSSFGDCYSTLNASGLAWRIAGLAVSFARTSAGTGPST